MPPEVHAHPPTDRAALGPTIGVVGWTRPDWEPLWPEAGDAQRLGLLARTFGCLELDTTRFAVPALRTVQRWSAALGAGPCRALVEVPALLLEAAPPAEGEAARFRDALQPLVRKRLLGAALARFDVEFLHGPAELRRLGRIASALAPLPLALEVRHPSWWDPRALDALRGIGWSLAHVDVGTDWRRLPERHRPTGPIGLLRLVGHGRPGSDPAVSGPTDRHLGLAPDPSDHRYPPAAVLALAARARAIAAEVDSCFVIAANAVRGQALATAFELRWLCEGRGPLPPWPTLRAAFPDLAALDLPPPPLRRGP